MADQYPSIIKIKGCDRKTEQPRKSLIKTCNCTSMMGGGRVCTWVGGGCISSEQFTTVTKKTSRKESQTHTRCARRARKKTQ